MVNQAFENAGIEFDSLQGFKVIITGGQDRKLHILYGAFQVSSIREIEYTGPYNAYGGHIGLHAFYGCQDLTHATISCVTEIYESAFEGCSRLEEARFQDVHSIHYGAFVECHSLRRVMGSSVTLIGYQAFAKCSRLVYIESLPLVEKIERGAFYGCKSLTNVKLDNVVDLGAFAFSGCTSLHSLVLTAKVNHLGESFAPQTRSIELHRHKDQKFDKDAFAHSCTNRLLVVYGIPLPEGYVLPERLSLVTVTFEGHVLKVTCSGPDPEQDNPGIEPLATYIANEIVKPTVLKKKLPQDVIQLFGSAGNVHTAERVVFECATKARNGWLANAVRDKVDALFKKDRLQREAHFTATFADLAVVS